MSDSEPVDIMGVIAFPNPDKDQRVIRFIDSEYHTLFTIKDGESIVITRFDGEKMVFPCKYIDDCHVCIGNSAYHICCGVACSYARRRLHNRISAYRAGEVWDCAHRRCGSRL